MIRRNLALLVTLCCAMGALPRAHADVVCPDSSYVTVSFTKTFSGSYAPGLPYDYVTISPVGAESLADNGITIRAFLKNCQGQPLAGVPASDVVLLSPNLFQYFCTCLGGNVADGPTDQNGSTTFSGTIRGGGCARSLQVMAQGVQVGLVPVKLNSPDDISSGGPCQIDSHDPAVLRIGAEVGLSPDYNICRDFNEDGQIDISDLVYMGRFRHAGCQP